MAQHLAADMPLSNSVKSRDMRPTSRTITALLVAVGTGFAVSAMIGAPIAVAQSCKPNQEWINGECVTPPPPPEDFGVPPGGQQIVCTGAGCHVLNGPRS